MLTVGENNDEGMSDVVLSLGVYGDDMIVLDIEENMSEEMITKGKIAKMCSL